MSRLELGMQLRLRDEARHSLRLGVGLAPGFGLGVGAAAEAAA